MDTMIAIPQLNLNWCKHGGSRPLQASTASFNSSITDPSSGTVPYLSVSIHIVMGKGSTVAHCKEIKGSWTAVCVFSSFSISAYASLIPP